MANDHTIVTKWQPTVPCLYEISLVYHLTHIHTRQKFEISQKSLYTQTIIAHLTARVRPYWSTTQSLFVLSIECDDSSPNTHNVIISLICQLIAIAISLVYIICMWCILYVQWPPPYLYDRNGIKQQSTGRSMNDTYLSVRYIYLFVRWIMIEVLEIDITVRIYFSPLSLVFPHHSWSLI
jgi:hypothetical protein